jgi:Lon protease-like protein
VAASWDRFAGDYDDDARIADRHGLLARLRRYSTARGLEIDWQGLAGMPDALLTNLLVTSLPLEPPDKQALVETVALNDRARLMSQLLDLAPTAPAQSPSRPH